MSQELLEVEVKVAVRDLNQVRSRLKELGARKLASRREEDVYFNHPHRDFSKTKEALRVRISPEGCILTYKAAMSGTYKIRREIETRCSDATALLRILEALGFQPIVRIVKLREEYQLDEHIKLCLDHVERLGDFVEIEILCRPENIKEAERRIKAIVSRLGLEGPLITAPYLELMLTRQRGKV